MNNNIDSSLSNGILLDPKISDIPNFPNRYVVFGTDNIYIKMNEKSFAYLQRFVASVLLFSVIVVTVYLIFRSRTKPSRYHVRFPDRSTAGEIKSSKQM